MAVLNGTVRRNELINMLATPYVGKLGETMWSLSGQRARVADLPFTEEVMRAGLATNSECRSSPTYSQANNVVWPNCTTIAVLGLLFFSVEFMRFRRMIVPVWA